ncbi:hypothetical protein, partial [Lentibacillus jeotgali]|uniref:hypothetical protein n=1 Tax=Lentibacillus jeotgali TaxID=558169 RepID=UPI00026264BB
MAILSPRPFPFSIEVADVLAEQLCSANISPKTKTSARKPKHQPENQNISPKTKTSARKPKH